MKNNVAFGVCVNVTDIIKCFWTMALEMHTTYYFK